MRRSDRPTGRDITLAVLSTMAIGATVVVVVRAVAHLLVLLKLP